MAEVGRSKVEKLGVEELKEIAREVRRRTVQTLHGAGGGHYGGSLSVVEALTALYFRVLRYDSSNPSWEERDRFVLSKGHACASFSVALSMAGFFPGEWLESFNKFESPLGVHPDMHKIPGCDMSTGSLGHGLPVGVGMAIAGKFDGKGYRVFVMVGDGECQEGSIWEAAMAAAHHRLDNLVCMVDRNMLNLDGPTEEVMKLEPFTKKWESFGWCLRCVDGHDMGQVVEALESVPFCEGKPSVIILNTIKGKGIPFLEGKVSSHYSKLTDEQVSQVLATL